MKRREFIAASAALLVSPGRSRAQGTRRRHEIRFAYPPISTSAFRAPLRKFEHKARRRRMRKQPILCIGDTRLGGSDAAASVEHAALGADHAARLAHAAHE